MAEIRQSALSREYVRVVVAAKDSGHTVDPTPDQVFLAFMTAKGRPQSSDWRTANWEVDATVTPNVYYARCLVGPGGSVDLDAGTYTVWVKVSANPEIPIRSVGLLVIE